MRPKRKILEGSFLKQFYLIFLKVLERIISRINRNPGAILNSYRLKVTKRVIINYFGSLDKVKVKRLIAISPVEASVQVGI